MIKRVLNSKTKTITFAALVVSIFSLLSRVLGILRNNLLGNIFPAGQTDIYFAAFRIPDFVFSILITGGITAAFLPVFSRYFQENEKKGRELAGNVFFVFLLALSILSFVLFLFSNSLVNVIAPGFSSYQKIETARLMRIMFLSPIILGVSAILSSILQYFNLFLAYSLAPVFYNLGIIFGILFLSPRYGLEGIAFGVIIGAFMHLLIQVPPALKHCFINKFIFNLRDRGLIRIFKLMIPRTIGALGFHINIIVMTAIASTLSVGAIRTFVFSNDLYGAPIGLIGISFAIAAFPSLSRSFTRKDNKEFLDNFTRVFSEIIFLSAPLSLMFFLLRAQIVRLLYGTLVVGSGYFGWYDTRLTAACLGVFSLSVLAACLIPFLAKTFYSAHDTRTPVKIALVSVAINILLAFGFTHFLQTNGFFQQTITNFLKLNGINNIAVIGLPLALSISSIVQCVLLFIFLKKKIQFLEINKIYNAALRVLPAILVMSIVIYFGLRVGAYLFDTNTVFGLSGQFVFVSFFSIISYFTMALFLKIPEFKHLIVSIKKQFKKTI